MKDNAQLNEDATVPSVGTKDNAQLLVTDDVTSKTAKVFILIIYQRTYDA